MSRHRSSARAACWALAATFTLAACGGIDLQQLADVPRLASDDLDVKLPQTSKLLAANGKLITTLHGEENRTIIPLERMPAHLRDAVVAIEDERFFVHDGVDIKAIARAALENAESGRVEQGGSTITQQYVKNILIAPRRRVRDTIERKIDEAALARQLEQRLSKDEILERYLNTVYFGNGAYGVQAAAKTYFGKGARRLSLKQSALVAAMIRTPSDYDPYRHPRRAKRRRNLVLRKMSDLGSIGADRARKASTYPLGLEPLDDDRYPAPYFVDYVKRLLVFHPRFKMLGKTPAQRDRRLIEGGLRVHTTLNLRAQKSAERAVRSVLTERQDPHAALVALDPDNGHVRALVGGRNYFARRRRDRFAKLNLAIVGEPKLGRSRDAGEDARRAPGTGRQAGSAFKPFVLAAALERSTPLYKTYPAPECMTFPTADNGGPWEVCNYGEASYGATTLLDATVRSINVVYAQLVLDIGPKRPVKLADAMGINTDLLPVPSAVLGTNPVNALGMASAFSTFASYGVARRPVAITKIVEPGGDVIFEAQPRQKRVLDEAVAYTVTGTLERVIEAGTGTAAQIGRPAAGKTGTAQEYRDAWFAGYTPDLVASVWVGYPEASISMKTACATSDPNVCRPTRISVTGGSWPAQIWQRFMSAALAGTEPTEFEVPEGLEQVVIDVRTGCLAQSYTPTAYRRTVILVGDRRPPVCAPPPPPAPAPQPQPSDDDDDEAQGPPGRGHGDDRTPPGHRKRDDDD